MTNNIIIYKIFCKNEEIKDCYIGSTTNLKRRILDHKSHCNNEKSKKYNNYKYIFIRENGGWDNWDYSIICKCTKEDRYKIERWYIENEKFSNLNKSIPTRTNKEYYQKNKEKYKEIFKQYREKNKDKISKKKKIKITCECGSIIIKHHKARHEKSKKHLDYSTLNFNKK